MGLACTGLPWVTAMETAMETAATVPTALATGVRQPTSHLSLQQEMVEVATGLSLPLSRQPRSAFRPKLLLQVHPSTAAWDQETVTEQALALEQGHAERDPIGRRDVRLSHDPPPCCP